MNKIPEGYPVDRSERTKDIHKELIINKLHTEVKRYLTKTITHGTNLKDIGKLGENLKIIKENFKNSIVMKKERLIHAVIGGFGDFDWINNKTVIKQLKDDIRNLKEEIAKVPAENDPYVQYELDVNRNIRTLVLNAIEDMQLVINVLKKSGADKKSVENLEKELEHLNITNLKKFEEEEILREKIQGKGNERIRETKEEKEVGEDRPWTHKAAEAGGASSHHIRIGRNVKKENTKVKEKSLESKPLSNKELEDFNVGPKQRERSHSLEQPGNRKTYEEEKERVVNDTSVSERARKKAGEERKPKERAKVENKVKEVGDKKNEDTGKEKVGKRPSLIIEDIEEEEIIKNQDAEEFLIGDRKDEITDRHISEGSVAERYAKKLVERGNELFKNEKYTEAFDEFSKAAEMGSAFAYHRLGIMYEEGMGVEASDIEKAIEHYRKAADKGFVSAKYHLATLYFEIAVFGPKIKSFGNLKKAAKSMQSAAKDNHPAALNSFGFWKEHGLSSQTGLDVIKINHEEAFENYTKAAELGNRDALNNLIRCYDKGIGTPKDPEKARELEKKL